jgi:hypothetical protein
VTDSVQSPAAVREPPPPPPTPPPPQVASVVATLRVDGSHTSLAHRHIAAVVLLDGACSTRVTLAAARAVLDTHPGLAGVPRWDSAVLTACRGGRWPLPLPLPAQLPLPAAGDVGDPGGAAVHPADQVWGVLRDIALAEPAISALDPTGACCRLLLHWLPVVDLKQVLAHPDAPLQRHLVGWGNTTDLTGGMGVYCRYRALGPGDLARVTSHASAPRGKDNGTWRLLRALVAVLDGYFYGGCRLAPASAWCKYVGKGVNVQQCWEAADAQDGGGRALPRPFQELFGALVGVALTLWLSVCSTCVCHH